MEMESLTKKKYRCKSCKHTTVANLKPGDILLCPECGEPISSTDEVKEKKDSILCKCGHRIEKVGTKWQHIDFTDPSKTQIKYREACYHCDCINPIPTGGKPPTRERLKNRVLNWWKNSSLMTVTEGQVQALAESLEDEIVEIAKEAYQRGKEGKEF